NETSTKRMRVKNARSLAYASCSLDTHSLLRHRLLLLPRRLGVVDTLLLCPLPAFHLLVADGGIALPLPLGFVDARLIVALLGLQLRRHLRGAALVAAPDGEQESRRQHDFSHRSILLVWPTGRVHGRASVSPPLREQAADQTAAFTSNGTTRTDPS